jgi:hypothetical protein
VGVDRHSCYNEEVVEEEDGSNLAAVARIREKMSLIMMVGWIWRSIIVWMPVSWCMPVLIVGNSSRVVCR